MMRKTADTLRRQWALLNVIPAYPRWRSTRDLHERMRDQAFDVNIRTIQRDLDWLSEPFPLISEARCKTLYWQWMKNSPGLEIPAMSRPTALVFQLANLYLQPLMPGNVLTLLEPYFHRASEALSNTRLSDWNSKVMHIEAGPRLTPPEIDPGVRDVVYGALLEGMRFEAEYTKRYETEPVTYKINPLGIVTKEGMTYLVCTLWDYTDIRQLAVHRIQAAELLEEEAGSIDGFSLEKYVHEESAFGFLDSTRPIRLKALFSEGAAFHLTERKLSEDQVLKETADGRVRLSATVADTAELRWWLLGFGEGVEVIGPKSLRNEFMEIVKSMARLYS